MTTIAWDGIRIASDSRTICGGVIVNDHERKLFKLDGGAFLGTCGETCRAAELIDWITTNTKHSGIEISGLYVDGSRGYLYEGCTKAQRVKPPYAIGSGAGYALAAMRAGADAVKAVRIAAGLDPGTGGRVRVVRCVDG